MIISHKHKYLFVELPLTGSTAIRKELQLHYDGSPILSRHHATYRDFLRVATEEEKTYYVFSCVRNPLDLAVSNFFKLKTDHKGHFTNPEKSQLYGRTVRYINSKKFQFIRERNPDFSTFFLKFYRIPYNNWSSLSHKDFDFVIRFENLRSDFAAALKLFDIEPKRPLPVTNRTSGKQRDFVTYYSPEAAERAKWVFGAYMKQWGYDFPPKWGPCSVSWWNHLEFEFLNIFRNFYWKFLRYRI